VADFLIQATLSNLFVSTLLAVVAWFVQRRVRSASLANLLWAIVLVKMVTPPLFSLPVFEVPSIARFETHADTSASSSPPVAAESDSSVNNFASAIPLDSDSSLNSSKTYASLWSRGYGLAIFTWIAVSSLLFLVSAFRIARFHGLLKANSREHSELTTGLGEDVARKLEIGRRPKVFVSSAHVAPFVWWKAGRAIIVVSEQAIRRLDDDDLRLVITHEMAHIKRRDHWFRWLEWFTVLGLWWNPVTWWARAQLRISEEMACDDLVLRTTRLKVHQYANALLNMAELLCSPAIRPPAVASAINSGGNLEKRLTMMIADKSWPVPASLRMGIVVIAFCILPLGFVNAQDFEAVERRLGGAVEAGEITLQQASTMIEALKRSSGFANNRDGEMEAKKRRYMAFAKELEQAVEAGKISKKDAETKLIDVRQDMFGDKARDKASNKEAQREKDKDREMAARRQRYVELAKFVETAVKAGKLSKEDAEKKMNAVRQQLFGDADPKRESRRRGRYVERQKDLEMDVLKERYMNYVEEIKAAVEAGKLSAEAAEKKIGAVRKDMFGGGERKNEPRRRSDKDLETNVRKQRYMAFVEEIKAAVAAGKLSEEEAKEKLNAIRQDLVGGADRKKKTQGGEDDYTAMEVRKRRYLQYANEIKKALDAGKISKEAAEKELIGLRRKMFDESSQKRESRKRNADESTDNQSKRSDREVEFRKELFGR